jgi:hypothetical protein
MIVMTCGQSSRKRPMCETVSQRRFAEFQFFRPLTEGLRASLERDSASMHRVVHLCSLGSPDTVVRRVTSIIIDTLKRMAPSRFRSHVRKKYREVMPRLADSNSSSTVTMIIRMFRVPTSLQHASPAAIFCGRRGCRSVSMPRVVQMQCCQMGDASRAQWQFHSSSVSGYTI